LLDCVPLRGRYDRPSRKEVDIGAVSRSRLSGHGRHQVDRLPVRTTWKTLTNVDTAQIAYAPLSEMGQPTVQPPLVATANPPHPDFASRHRHDTHDLKAKPRTRTNSTSRPKKRPPDGSPDDISQTSDCHLAGLRPLLERLNLSALCGS
jgi:hypothetical protein